MAFGMQFSVVAEPCSL